MGDIILGIALLAVVVVGVLLQLWIRRDLVRHDAEFHRQMEELRRELHLEEGE